MSEAVLTAKGIGHSFVSSGGPDLLSGVDLELQAGDTVAITGVSGCGKSTLLHILGGLSKPSEGQVFIKKSPLGELTPKALGKLRNLQLGFVYQFHHLLGEFTAAENVAMPMLVAGMDWAKALDVAKELLATVGLQDRADSYPSKLSGGERQRVAIARALVNSPACVIADEPTGNLDRKTASAVIDILLEACEKRGCSLLIATHDLELAARLGKRYELRDKHLVSVG